MDKADIPFLSATELSRLIKAKDVSPVEATQAYLERIDDLDYKFNSYLVVCRDQAIQVARQAERDISRGNYLGPMHGIPVAVKDQMWAKGIRCSGGSRILTDFVPTEDSTTVKYLKRAGAVLLGKTNMPEFAIGGSHRYSTPRNPWDLDMFTGGSSSGSAAATAAYLCATSVGEDGCGSVRRPAASCGLVGLMPTWGRVSRYGLMPGRWSMDNIGPISRTVEDAAITLWAIAGYDSKDPHSWNTPVPDYRKALEGDIIGIRVGLVTEFFRGDVAEEPVRQTVVKAVSVLAELGASVEEVSIPLAKHSMLIARLLLTVEAASTHRDWIKQRPWDYSDATRVMLLTGSIIPAQVYYKVQKIRSLLRRQVLDAMERCDILVLPTLGKPAMGMDDSEREFHPYILTPIFNVAGAPAISLPCGFSPAGLPIGLQIAGRPGEEETVLKVAHAYEQNSPWHTRRPPAA